MAKYVSRKRPIMAVYGGTFDPFHEGHAAICEAVLATPHVSQLRIVPCYSPALKAQATAPAEHRLKMLDAWRAQRGDADKIVIDSMELQRKGASYTIDTVSALEAQYPEFDLFFVLGTDAWNSLSRWKQFEALIKAMSFWVFARAGESPIQDYSFIERCQHKQEFMDAGPNHCWIDCSVKVPLSSSELRNSKDYEQWPVPLTIKEYIQRNHLYR